jgi:Ca2+-binding EF-hand superfamily protein
MSVELSEDQIDEIKNSFAQYDNDGDGKISVEDFDGVMKEFGNICNIDELKFIVFLKSYFKFY